eukprot:TRINITY_DN6516_c0_g1_i5.p1 TRINITY_DN6516_c0_g1~~TRINITY_DN6516_c0_g1_i5.p1  ORF type:complete len:431 (+),score=151.79 TRINITY_DN6516_c0_g1_i5:108-1400(+)
MFLALWLFVLLAVLFIYRKTLYCPTEDTGLKHMLSKDNWQKYLKCLLSPEVILFLALCVTTLADLHISWGFLHKHDYLRKTVEFPEDPDRTARWELPDWMRIISMCCPVIIVCIMIISGYHVFLHYWVSDFHLNEFRDKSVQVILLPMVYSIMAFKSVIRMWKCFMNDFSHTGSVSIFEHDLGGNFSTNVEIEMELYESNYRVADMYEAWALYCFGKLTLMFLKETELRREKLMEAMFQITNLGVQAFVFVAVLAACFNFYKPFMDMMRNSISKEEQGDTQGLMAESDYIVGFMDGLGFLGSSIAIYNLIRVETAPDLHYYLGPFQPFWKFWGTKILVSIAYFQTIVLKVINAMTGWYSPQQVNLVYSSLICFELVLITALHFSAWDPWAQWYLMTGDGVIDDEELRTGIAKRPGPKRGKGKGSYGATAQ